MGAINLTDSDLSLPDWESADRAYLAHHVKCRECIAAGIAHGALPRCVVGQPLWDAYNQAELPQALRTNKKSPNDSINYSH